MNNYNVTVRTTQGKPVVYVVIGTDSAAVHLAALTKYGVCGVTVKPV